MDKEEKEEGHIIDEVRVQLALGTMDYIESNKIMAFIAANSTDVRELTQIFWFLVDNPYRHIIYRRFSQNEHVPTILKRYVLPLANNRPIPEAIEKGFPRWVKRNET